MLVETEPQEALKTYDLAMRKIALMIGMFYGQAQQQEINELEDVDGA